MTVLPAMADSLTSDGWMAVVQERVLAPPWRDAMVALIGSYSVNTDFRPYNVVEEVVSRELFAVASVHETPLQTLEQPSERYVDALHARNGLMVEELGKQGTAEFDAQLLEVLGRYGARPNVTVRTTNRVTFGRPLRPV
ncbi:MAG: hypothetical protein AAFX99_36610 [Myxococcota bacterium]